MPATLTRLAGLALLVALADGCAPSCDSSCRKVIRCGLADNFELLECTEQCSRQDALYELEEDDTRARAFAEHRRCIGSSSCEELADDACYDEDLFLF